jgi:ribosome-associated protein
MPTDNGERFAIEAARVAHEHNADEVTVMDLRGLSPVTDFFVVCSGPSDRQRRTVCDMIREHGRTLGTKPLGVTGYQTANWILLDFVDVVIHIFAPEYREYYDLELLWGDATRLNWSPSATA